MLHHVAWIEGYSPRCQPRLGRFANLPASYKGSCMFRLSAPTKGVFFISVGLAIISVVLHVMAYMDISPVRITSDVVLLAGYLLLVAGILA